MSPPEEQLKIQRLFAAQATFIASSPDLAHLPEAHLPELAFAGRSNCGKSSLLNAVMGVKRLARTSNTPGRTQMFNFFCLADTLMLIDLPGYGFARASAEARKRWLNNWHGYTQSRAVLRHVFVLIDTRRGLMESDREIMSGLDKNGTSYGIVLTKSDKLPQAVAETTLNDVRNALGAHPAAWSEPLLSSAKTREGIAALRQEMLITAGFLTRPEPAGELS